MALLRRERVFMARDRAIREILHRVIIESVITFNAGEHGVNEERLTSKITVSGHRPTASG